MPNALTADELKELMTLAHEAVWNGDVSIASKYHQEAITKSEGAKSLDPQPYYDYAISLLSVTPINMRKVLLTTVSTITAHNTSDCAD